MERSIYEDLDCEASPSETYERRRLTIPEAEELSDGLIIPPMLTAKEIAMWRFANVDNLDVFLQDVYQYFAEKGFWCINLKRAINLLTVLFVVCFAEYLTHCIDYSQLRGATALAQIRRQQCMTTAGIGHKLALWLFAIFWFAKLFQYAYDVRRLWELKEFYTHLLRIGENEIQTISWSQIVHRIVQLGDSNLAVAGRAENAQGQRRKLDAHGIVNRIMRQENFLITMYTKDIFDLKVYLPFIGEYQFLSKSIEWCINLCVMDYVFNERGQVRPAFLNRLLRKELSDGLARRFQFAAIMSVIFAPVAVIYMSIYYFFRYFNEYRRDPGSIGSRRYTPLAEWKLRELNELYHLFRRRLNISVPTAMNYLSQFPKEKTEITLRFIMFVCGAFASVLGIVSIYDPELLALEITPGKTVLFYIGVFGSIIAVCRGMESEEASVFEPEGAMRQIIEFTHYMPDDWEGKLHTEKVKRDFCLLYDLRVNIVLRELLSIVLNPLILWYNLPKCSTKIVDFFREFSVHVDGLGHVCSFAVFNFDEARKAKQRSDALDRYYSTYDGKMLKSYLAFTNFYYKDRRKKHRSMRVSSSDVGDSIMEQYDQLNRLAPVGELDADRLTADAPGSPMSPPHDIMIERVEDSDSPELNLLPASQTSDGKEPGLINILKKAYHADRPHPTK